VTPVPPVDLPDTIFRAYDIRGTLGEEITPERLALVARVFVQGFLRPGGPEHPRVVLGRDLRASSEEIAHAVREGLVQAGAEVWDIGVVPTPLSYFVMGRWQATGGVMITASHNPPEFNGMKVRVGDRPFYAKCLQELREAALDPPDPVGGGWVVQRDPYAEYFEVALGYVRLARPLRVALDLGNGAGALTAVRLIEELGCELDLLFPEPDGGQFRGRGPDPTKEGALDALCGRVRELGADMGLAIDADGDRLVTVDETGTEVSCDRAVIPLCRHFLDEGHKSFVADARCTRSAIEDIEARGGRLRKAACGYPFILAAMHEENAVFGFETTGHYFHDNPDVRFDDASFSAAFLCMVLSRTRESLSSLIASAPTYHTSDDVRWECDDHAKFRVVERLTEEYAREFEVDTTDGVRVERPEGWALVRASNTAPEITMRWEGKTEEARDEIGRELQARVRAVMDELGA